MISFIKSAVILSSILVYHLQNVLNTEHDNVYVISGLSALQNGPCANFLGSLLDTWPQSEPEEYHLCHVSERSRASRIMAGKVLINNMFFISSEERFKKSLIPSQFYFIFFLFA